VAFDITLRATTGLNINFGGAPPTGSSYGKVKIAGTFVDITDRKVKIAGTFQDVTAVRVKRAGVFEDLL
jgi:hypothetical protein